MSSPKVSVILSLHNVENAPVPGLESALAQDFDDYEVVAVDDGSTDGTAAVLEDYARRHARLRIVRSAENLKLAGALNLAIREARADILMRIDHDDWAPPHRMARQFAFLQENPDVGVVSCAFDRLWAGGSFRDTIRLPLAHDAIVRSLTLGPSGMCHAGVMVRKACFLEHGFYDPAIPRAQDYELWLRWRFRVRFANLEDVLLRVQLPPVRWERTRGVTYWQMYRIHAQARRRNFAASKTKLLDLYGMARMHAFFLVREPIRRVGYLVSGATARP